MSDIAPLSEEEREVAATLIERYSRYIRKIASSVCKINNKRVLCKKDLYQAGAMGLFLAIKNNNDLQNITPAYIIKCIRNEMYREANRFQGVFLINNQIRKILNLIAQARKRGMDDATIATSMGFSQKKYKNYADLLDIETTSILEENL